MQSITLVSTTIITIPTNTQINVFAPSPTGAATSTTGSAQACEGGTLRLTLSATPAFGGNVASPILCDAIIETAEATTGPWREIGRMSCRAADGYSKRATIVGADAYVRGIVTVQGQTLKSAVVSLAGDAV